MYCFSSFDMQSSLFPLGAHVSRGSISDFASRLPQRNGLHPDEILFKKELRPVR